MVLNTYPASLRIDPTQYFTLVNVALVLLGPLVYRTVDIVYTSLIALGVGSYVLWIHPRRVQAPPAPQRPLLVLKSVPGRLAADLLFHAAPFVYACWRFAPLYARMPSA